MLPPPIQTIQKVNFNSEKSPNRQTYFGTHKKWQEKLVDSVSSDSNVQPTIVLPNSPLTTYDHKLNSHADDVNQLLSDYHSPMYIKSTQSKKSWLQDLLQKEVAKPTLSPAHVQNETLTMHKLDDTNRYYNSKMPVESKTELTPPYFVPTIQPMIDDNKKFLFNELPKPMIPMNLIIQGHSRVKTYGQGTDEKNPKIIEVKSAENPVINRVVSKDENGIQYDVKHLHTNNSNKTISASINSTAEESDSPVAGLLSLLDFSFDDFLDNVTMPDVVNQTKSNEIKVL